MKNLNEVIQKNDTAELWALVGDISEILKKYTPDQENNKYMFWYAVYKRLESEIDSRLVIDFTDTEG